MSDGLEFLEVRPDINVLESEYKRLLGFPSDYVLQDRPRELADWAREWYAKNGRPWIYGRQTSFELDAAAVRINGTVLSSNRLRDQLHEAEANEAVLVAASAGAECEEKARELWLEGKPDEYLFLEVYGSAVVEHLVTQVGARLCAWADAQGGAILPHYSPGYSGWDVAQQRALFGVIRHTSKHVFPEELAVLDSGMLRPKKALLALFGCTQRLDKITLSPNLVPCENCSFSPCQFRRAPFRAPLPGLEEISRLQPNADSGANGTLTRRLKREAAYTVNQRALRKWSSERLRVRTLEDGSVEAHFTYEGTTCSNLGRQILVDYRVTLASREDGYVLKHLECVPATEDTGFAQMCEYLANREKLTSRMAEEKPLLGKPLDDVLDWVRPYNPSGCYCHEESRMHKWGLVLEVIHYTLAEREKRATT